MIIDSVFVKPQFRRRGFGTQLINRAVALARARLVDAVELVVTDGNLAADRLYKKCGFSKAHKQQYRLIMRKL